MIEKFNRNFKQIFKYRNSLIFKEEYNNENDFLNSLKTKDNSSIVQKNNIHLNKIIELTKLDLMEFKKVIGDANYHNMNHYLYNVNDFLTSLLDKNEILKNHVDLVIADLVKDDTFKNLNEQKIERILSLFSEIYCIGFIVSDTPEFVLSVNNGVGYKKNGRFDLVITKGNLSYYFDVERVNSLPIEKWDSVEYTKIENKIKDKIDRIIGKWPNEDINRPLFLLLDVSDWALLETKDDGKFKVGCVWDSILKILENYFNMNKESMQDLKSIVEVVLFYSFIGVTMSGEFAYISWSQRYSNMNHRFPLEKNQIIELNNLIFDKLRKGQERIISKYGDSRFEIL